MKKLLPVLFVTVTITTLSFAQNTISGNFNSIRISGSANVYVKPATQSSVEPASANTRGISIEGNTLHISRTITSSVYVNAPAINSIEISGNGEVTVDSAVNTDNLNIDVSGNGKTYLDLNAKNIHIDASGNYSGDFSGAADNLDINVSGRANLHGYNLKVKNCRVSVSGLSKVSVDVSDSLFTNISGNGTVIYKNRPAYVSNDNSGCSLVGDLKTSTSDTMRISLGKKEILIISNNGAIEWKNKNSGPNSSSFHWAGFEMGLDNYLDKNNKFEIPRGSNYLDLNTGKSVFVNINLFEARAKLYKEYIMAGTGLGFSFNNYRFSNRDSILVPNSETVTVAAATQSYNKYKLAVDYITVPALLEFNTSQYNKHSFHIGGGVVFNYRIGSHVKLKSDSGKQKIHDDYNLNPIKLDTRVSIGYGSLNLFATYALQGLFKDNHGPELHPVTVGITFLNW